MYSVLDNNITVADVFDYICNIVFNIKRKRIMTDIFGFGSGTNENATEEKTNLETGEIDVTNGNGEQVTELDGDGNKEKENEEKNEKEKEKPADVPPTETEIKPAHDLEEGTVLEIGEDKYTVDKDGNLIDKDGNIFKEAKDVPALLKESEITEEDKTPIIDIDSIIKQVGTEVVDEKGKAIKFDNTPEGVAAYIDSVLDIKRTEYANAGVQSLIEKYPIVTDFLNYYIANGNSAKGFGEQLDRSNVVIDQTNVAQQESIIREAWKESNRPGNVEGYIKYLKDTNTLYDVANAELEALKKYDADNKAKLEKEAQEAIKADEEKQKQYWNGVKKTIDSRKIAGYKIPDTIIINRNGKTLSVTPDDFFNYLYQVDDEGYSRYERDLMATDAQKRQENDMLAAYLMFTGNGYESLVNMAIAEKEAKTLKLKSIENKSKTIKITKPASKKNKTNIADDIAAGY